MVDNKLIEDGTREAMMLFFPIYFVGISIFVAVSVYFTNTSYFTTPLSLLVDLLVFYLWHYQAHHDLPWVPFNKKCREYHHIHHELIFPPGKFYGSDVNEAKVWEDESQQKYFLVRSALPLNELPFFDSLQNVGFAVLLVIIATIIKYQVFKLSVYTILITLLQGMTVNYVGNYLHLSFHTKNHFLSQYKWFRQLRTMHVLHHNDDINYSIAFFGFDSLFNTFKKIRGSRGHNKKQL